MDCEINLALEAIPNDQNISRNLQVQKHNTNFINNNLKELNIRNVFK